MKRQILKQFHDRFARAPEVAEALDWLGSGGASLAVSGLRGGSGAMLMALIGGRVAGPLLIVTSTLERAENLADGIEFFGERTLIFPPFETLPFEPTEPSLQIASGRARVLHDLIDPGAFSGPIVAPVDALLPLVLPREAALLHHLRIEWGEPIDVDALAEKLVRMGYDRESMVESPGEFSIRGSIVDIYPAEADHPWRLDLFGDELESIRPFDPATQRSLPAREDIECIQVLPRSPRAMAMEHLAAGEKLVPFFDHLPAETLVVLEGPMRIAQRLEYADGIAQRHWQEIQPREGAEPDNFFVRRGLSPEDWILPSQSAQEALERLRRIELADLSLESDRSARQGAAAVSIPAQSFESVTPNFKTYLELIQRKRFDGYRIAIVCDNAGQARRLDELFGENGISAIVTEPPASPDPSSLSARTEAPIQPAASDVVLMTGDLHEGFIFPSAKIIVLTDREMFGRYKRRRLYRKHYQGKSIADPSQIQRGDFVVHADHGIGQYQSIRRQNVDNRVCEFMEIEYQDGDRLLVPVERLHLVQKYASADGKKPALDKMGGKRWARRRKKTHEAVRKLAGELLHLYARREAAQRPACGPDTVWLQEFEASFLYEETPDQITAIRDVKHDLTSPKPTDRLICGDVGYGKTEVAIRAAFKVLTEERQVAILVPTTILCMQHYQTFTERLADYPFKVEMLSRFRTAAQLKATVKGLATGEVHLVVGTHRLISKDVRFKDLGLLVIDEEQRFGVKQKEKIKALKTNVDVITMTATPIPRTLHMALSKLRDLSLIQTPPADRLPIKTRTIHFEKDRIEEAILRELNRGGQVYFVHNRVASIGDVAQSLGAIVPKARIAVGHGQMDEKELEEIMLDFIQGKTDILVSTTIIENGIDIPNVNTIIINRADAFGLAQLYQLRGRVGRDVRQAYAYLILPQGQPITDVATKRLAALEEFTELGMGFSVAMRDMEIRGTGNLLGHEQSGAIDDVGFDLYIRLLEEAVLELKGERSAEPPWPTEVKWPVDQWLPEDYIPVEAQRIRFYRELAGAWTTDDLDLIQDELVDRYGAMPPEAANLINAPRVKLALARWKVDTVKTTENGPIHIRATERGRELADAIAARVEGADWVERIGYRSDGTVLIHMTGEQPELGPLLGEFAHLIQPLPEPESAREAIVPVV